MKRLWVPIAAICMVIAIALFIQLNYEAAFIVAAVGAVMWFLNYRGHVKGRLDKDHFDDESYDEKLGSHEDYGAEDSRS